MNFTFKRPSSLRLVAKRAALLLSVIIASFAVVRLLERGVTLVLRAAQIPQTSVIGHTAVVTVEALGFAGVAGLYLWRRGYLDSINIRGITGRQVNWISGGYIAAILLAAGASVATDVLGIETSQNEVILIGKENPVLFLVLIPLSFLAIAPSEELLFRGLIQKRFEPLFGTGGAVIAAGSLFAPAHFLVLQGSLAGTVTTIIILFIVSSVFGFAYAATDNLLVPVLIHGCYNAALFGIQYVRVTDVVSLSMVLF